MPKATLTISTSKKLTALKPSSAMAAKDKAKHYEIFVDAFESSSKKQMSRNLFSDVVTKIGMTTDTEQVKIIIYNSAASPRNDRGMCFWWKEKQRGSNELGIERNACKVFFAQQSLRFCETEQRHLT